MALSLDASPPARAPAFLDRAKGLLGHRLTPLLVTLLGVSLALPALEVGWVLDDHLHQLFLSGRFAAAHQPAPYDLYAFMPQDPVWRAHFNALGAFPWHLETMHAAFFRPLSSLLLQLDHALVPGSALAAHVHSLLWLGLLVGLAALLYRELLDKAPPWVAGLAALLYAVDDGHSVPAAWVANRNALIAVALGFAALLLHVRWRRGRDRVSGFLAPLLFALALLGGEAAVSIAAYLFAYALFLDHGTVWRRIAGLVPAALVGLVWSVVYVRLGYGAGGSAIYVDPITDASAYLSALGPRLLVLLQGQLSLVAADTFFALTGSARTAFLALAALTLAFLGWAFFGLLRVSPLARFFATGMVLAILPACATFPHDRLLLAAGLGGFGLIALFLAGEGAPAFPGRYATGFLIAAHLVISPLTLPAKAWAPRLLGGIYEGGARSLDSLGDLDGRTVVMVNGPDFFLTGWSSLIRNDLGLVSPKDLRILGVTWDAMTVRREDARTLRLESPSFLTSPFSPLLLEPGRRFRVGERFRLLDGVEVEVVQVNTGGMPAALICRFPGALESLPYLWAAWSPDGYRPFPLPRIGEHVALPRVRPLDLLDLARATRP